MALIDELDPSERSALNRAKAGAAARAASAPTTTAPAPARTDVQIERQLATAPAPTPPAPVSPKPPLSTNDKIAATIEAYAKDHPAGPHQHYGTTLNPDGTPRLYWDTGWSAAGPIGGTGTTPVGPTGGNGSGTGSTGGSTGPNLPHGVVANSFQNADGTFTIVYSDGFSQVTGTKTNPVDTPSGQNAINLLTTTFAGYGLGGDIASAITGLIKENYTADTITALVQDPAAINSSDPSVKAMAQAWQTRFSGNVARQKAGLPVLSPAEYLATESQYKDIMMRAGLPAATISNDYIGKLMAADVSPVETQQRIDAARAAVTSEDPYVIQQLNAMGLGTGDMVLHLLDPNVASNVIAQKVTAAQIGGEASRAGVNTTQDYAMQLAGQGVTQSQAQQGFQAIAQQLPANQALAARYQGYGTPQGVGSALQTAVFGAPGTQTQAQAEAELKRLQTQEVSAFSGSSGAGKGSLGISDTSGLS